MKYIILFFFAFYNSYSQSLLISSGDSWKYLDNGTDQGSNWINENFNDSSWPSGPTQMGYGEGDEATIVGFGPDASQKFITTYFRKVITLTNTYANYILKGKRDDGVVVYINGVEVFKDGLSGPVNYNSLATQAVDDGQVWLSTILNGSVLKLGSNTIAVEIHQSAINSSDISFDFELIRQNAIFVTRGPYLQMATSNSMQLKYKTNSATDTKIKFGTDINNLSLQIIDNTISTEHMVNLTNLLPNTKYYYSISNATEVIQSSNQHFFYTSPLIGSEKKSRIWVTGDCGTGTTTQTNVKNSFLNYTGNNYIDLWLLLGDNAYSSGYDNEYQTLFFEPYQNSKTMKQTPIFPTPGNHDYYSMGQSNRNGAYYQIFNVPTNAEIGGVASLTEGYYSYNYANIHFISLDSYGTETANNYRLSDTLNNPQINWLKQDLATNTQKWTIVYWHHPPYTMGTHNSDTELELVYIREKVLPILEKNNVDLILCGHSHNYERTRLIKGHYGLESTFNSSQYNKSTSTGRFDGTLDSCPYIKTSDQANKGVVYVVAGSAGWTGGTQPSYPHDAMAYSNSDHGGSIYLEIEANRLDAKWIAADGAVKDQFTIMKDVNKTKEVVIAPNETNLNLTASWIGNYSWSNALTTKNIQINPIIGATYSVMDDKNCLRDSFTIKVNPDCQNSHQILIEIGGNSILNFQANQSITASNILQIGTKINYNAGKEIILTPGFKTNIGAIFKAQIQGCGN